MRQYAGVGTTLSLGIVDRRRGENPALEGSDLVTYRRLASREDPFGVQAWNLRKQIAPL
jgi:7,8-dihydropterin-6-yl-methyl-4-(beta-D-ribofuranosyl)aminobenzene 5'-phosphate synthase